MEYCGKEITDQMTLKDCAIQQDCLIEIFLISPPE